MLLNDAIVQIAFNILNDAINNRQITREEANFIDQILHQNFNTVIQNINNYIMQNGNPNGQITTQDIHNVLTNWIYNVYSSNIVPNRQQQQQQHIGPFIGQNNYNNQQSNVGVSSRLGHFTNPSQQQNSLTNINFQNNNTRISGLYGKTSGSNIQENQSNQSMDQNKHNTNVINNVINKIPQIVMEEINPTDKNNSMTVGYKLEFMEDKTDYFPIPDDPNELSKSIIEPIKCQNTIVKYAYEDYNYYSEITNYHTFNYISDGIKDTLELNPHCKRKKHYTLMHLDKFIVFNQNYDEHHKTFEKMASIVSEGLFLKLPQVLNEFPNYIYSELNNKITGTLNNLLRLYVTTSHDPNNYIKLDDITEIEKLVDETNPDLDYFFKIPNYYGTIRDCVYEAFRTYFNPFNHSSFILCPESVNDFIHCNSINIFEDIFRLSDYYVASDEIKDKFLEKLKKYIIIKEECNILNTNIILDNKSDIIQKYFKEQKGINWVVPIDDFDIPLHSICYDIIDVPKNIKILFTTKEGNALFLNVGKTLDKQLIYYW